MPSTRTRDLPEEFLAATRKSQEAMIRAIGVVAHHPARRGRGPLSPKGERAEVCVPVPVGVRIFGRTGGDHAPAAASSSRFRNVDLLRERIKPGESPGQCSPRSST